jgi:hypothetical protein
MEERVDTDLNLYYSDWVGVVGTVVGYAVGFVIVYAVLRWVLEHYFKGKTEPQPTPHPSDLLKSRLLMIMCPDAKIASLRSIVLRD